MPIPAPNLDDRTFEQLVEEARRRIATSTPEWTDLTPGDPGMVLVELFAYLTEEMILRLNRLPEKAYVEFLRLLGVRIRPPAAASAILRFTRSRPGEQAVEIRRGTRVTASRSDGGREPAEFVTVRAAEIAQGETEVEVQAFHCRLIEGELAGTGTGQPGTSLTIRHPPITAPSGEQPDLVVGVEVDPDEIDSQAPVIRHGDKTYRIWREVETFANLGADRHVYSVDRVAGRFDFAPAARVADADEGLAERPEALGEIVPAGSEVRIWYRSGGGPEGNVAANVLTVMRDSIPGVEVTNPAPATGGRAEESLENALIRGPRELHSLQRAVTARDFELVALASSPAVARAIAVTTSALWVHSPPGTVEVLLVPNVPEEQFPDGRLTIDMLQQRESQAVLDQIQVAFDERRPLGTTCLVNWSRYKAVRARVRIVVRREADKEAVQARVLNRLRRTINPLPTALNPTGWPFGQALRVSHVYDIALAEPGVLWVDQVRLQVDEVPDRDVGSLAADHFQHRTWYAGSGHTVFRSLNNGEGWESVGAFPDEEIHRVATHPGRPGMIAVATHLPDQAGSRIHLSFDCGETWDQELAYTMDFDVEDVAWMMRAQDAVLLLATDVGIYELVARTGAVPVQVLVDPDDQDRGFYAIAASQDMRGQVSVAVASQALGGVFLSSDGGRSNTYRRIGLNGEDIRVLSVQYDGPRSFLWAGAAAAGGDDPGKGCFRWELRGQEDPPEGWRAFAEGWAAGSCWSIAFLGSVVLAGSFRGGVLSLRVSEQSPVWETPDVRCGLPLRDRGRFQPVDTVAVNLNENFVMAGGSEGIFSKHLDDTTYRPASSTEFSDKVTLPPTWLFCSSGHEVQVEDEDEAERD